MTDRHISRLTIGNIKEIEALNRLYKKTKHSEAQYTILKPENNKYNLSLGIYKNNSLSEYIIAAYNPTTTIVDIENFIWKNSSAFKVLLTKLINSSSNYSNNLGLFVCDKGLRILKHIIHKDLNGISIESETKEPRYNEILNRVILDTKDYKNKS